MMKEVTPSITRRAARGALLAAGPALVAGLAQAAPVLSASEIAQLHTHIQSCWTMPPNVANAPDLRVSVRFRLDPEGAILGEPEIVVPDGVNGVDARMARSALRAVRRCAPYHLPAEKYAAWAELIITFDPNETH